MADTRVNPVSRRSTRFIFVSDATAPTAGRQSSTAAEPRYGWRVIAANNRPLGRSATVFDTYQDCREAAAALHDRVSETSSSVLFNTTRGHWTWTVALDARPVAVCVHPYLRRIECARALRQFTDAVSAGVPSADGLRLFGERALRGYDAPATDRGAR
jgi:hypothetical protein